MALTDVSTKDSIAQVVETSVNVTTNSPSQDYNQPHDHTSRTYDMTPEFKPVTLKIIC